MTFEDIIGQDAVKERLIHDLRENRTPHALMLCGPRGVGKLPLALALAKALICEEYKKEEAPKPEEPVELDMFGNPIPKEQPLDMFGNPIPAETSEASVTTPSPLGGGLGRGAIMCDSFAHPDLHFSFPIIKKKNSSSAPICDDYLTEWREQLHKSIYFDINDWLEDMKAENQQATYYVTESDSLLRKLAIKSSQGGRRVIIVWLPERMNQETANKLLKLIEEPPSLTHFIMVCEEPDQVLGTIISRTQRINVPRLSEKEISQALQVRHALPAEVANEIAHVAQGNYTQALHRMMAGNEESEFFDQFVSLMRLAYARRLKDLRAWSDEMAGRGRETQKRFLQYAQRLVRENFIYNFHHQDALNYQLRRESDFSSKFARFINEKNVIKIMDELSTAERDIEGNVNAKMVFFDFALKIIVLLIQ